MKNTKRLMAFLLSVIMTLALATAAFAADTNTLTIEGDGVKENHTFSAYQIFSGNYNDETCELENIDWGKGLNTAAVGDLVKDLKAEFASIDAVQVLTAASTPVAIASAIASIEDDSENAAALADIFAKYTTGTPEASAETKAPYTISGLSDGYYIVKDASNFTGDNDVISDFIMRIVSSESVNIKGDIPTVDKKVKTPETNDYEDGKSDPVNVKVGDILDYEIIGTLPSNYSDYAKYQMVFTDIPSENIALKTSADTYGVYVDDTKAKTGFTPVVTATGLSITIPDTKALKDASGNVISTDASSQIIVKYQAEVLSTTVPGTADVNSAKITYSKNPNWDGTGTPETGTTPPDDVKTVTQSFKFVKCDGTNNKLLVGAVFKILQDETVIKLVKISDTEYKVADSDDANTVETFETAVTTAAITIKGLNADVEYTLREVTAPTGYNKLNDDIPFSVSSNTTSAVPSITDSVYTTTEDVVCVANNSGTVLPATGGIGTVLFIAIGAIVVLASGVVLTAKKRLYNEG